MKHIFVVNPKSGKYNHAKEIMDALKGLEEKIDYEVYVSKCKGDSKVFVEAYCKAHHDESLRFYACGGDGTIYDVINGCFGNPHVEVGALAIGSGNDFIKNFHDPDFFLDIKKMIKANSSPIDILDVDGRYCANITNFGFDGEVTYNQAFFKKWPFVSGAMAYRLAAVSALLFKMNQPMKVIADEKVVMDEKGLLAIAANGYCYGGGFYSAPYAKIDDGVIDVVLVKKVSRLKTATFMKVFRAGQHITDPRTKDMVIYLRAKRLSIESDRKVAYAIDGEVFRSNCIHISIIPKAVKFVSPKEP